MGRFKCEDIEYPKGFGRNLEQFVQETWAFVDRQDCSAVTDRVVVIQNAATVHGDADLMHEAGELMQAIHRPLPYTIGTSLSPVASSPNNRPGAAIDGIDKMPAPRRNHPPRIMQLAKEKIRMAQFIDLTWRNGWYESRNGEALTLEDVNYWFGAIMHYDFDAQSGALSDLYSKDSRAQKLGDTLTDYIDAEVKRRENG